MSFISTKMLKKRVLQSLDVPADSEACAALAKGG